MSEADYYPAFPAQQAVSQSFKDFIADFYKTSDKQGATDEYLAFYEEDADVVIGQATASDRDGLRKVVAGMRERAASRRHAITKVFPWGSLTDGQQGAEYMLHGTVTYGLASGEFKTVPWMAVAKVNHHEGKGWKLASYHVCVQV